ncbi:MAG: rhomboid family intramembrane serine protease [Gemmatimonadetes bacterium]|nr:rhomboid family intramembrane serine protease [Gemmatimonadota bacterium]
MFPYKDDNPTLATPVVTFFLIGLNVAAWFFVQGMGTEPQLSASVCQLGLIPGEVLRRLPPGTPIPGPQTVPCVTGEGGWFSVVSSMFLHGGWFHLIGNCWFLWVFGNNVEDSMGKFRFLLFYLVTGVVAAAAQAAVNPSSAIPMVGASGAISGVMGAYIVLYPRVRVHMLVFLGIFITRIAVPAFFMLGYWFLLQVVGGLPTLQREAGGVAFWAHAGGFLAGMVLVFLFRDARLVEARLAHRLP